MINTLTVEDISFSYKNQSILNNINFKCQNGITALLGNNGMGKTTLMKILVGLKRPSNGEVMLNDVDLLKSKPFPFQKVGYLPQNFDIYHNVTGYDFLSYVFDLKNLKQEDKKQRIDYVVEKLQLQSVINKKFKTYSGGYKRRLGIAQAILGEPELIIIDEPSVGLDPEQRMEFRSYLSEISKTAVTLISTHIIEDVELYSDNILILKDTSIKFKGTVEEILNVTLPYISTVEISISELSKLKKIVHIIEEKRINAENIRVKFVENGKKIEGSYKEKEISLENAYVYYQKI